MPPNRMHEMDELERELNSELLRLYDSWKTIGYSATYFKRMLTPTDPIYKGPVGTVKHLLGKKLSEKSGFNRLKVAGKLQLSVEAMLAVQKKWHPLFNDREIGKARERYPLP